MVSDAFYLPMERLCLHALFHETLGHGALRYGLRRILPL